ncbi:CHAP domain-containing protein [Actinomadura sp. ATCC 31491]|uniref:CHAP domain-containing protein n=1 Tax=Actinomadura luzonensis TaxID=2805427 RepID=A0ABT0FVZ8_9ACTN|nr:CHAP domain-containing protein [Actinomadura luzonensis]MCK2216073.1 CHAP domain-containing protein [Actinomadura luzonensis]
MAMHRITAARKIDIARAALGATIAAAAFGAHSAANADSAPATAGQHLATSTSATTATTGTAGTADARPADHAAPRAHEETKISVTADQVLALARSQVGTSENAAGGGTPYQQWYAGSRRAAETIARDGGSPTAYLNAPWCAMFVSWVGEKTGARPQVGWDAYTVTYAKWFQANHRFGALAKPGAVVFFSWSGSKDLDDINHVGFVVKDNQNGTISTIEGNTGNGKVEERVRPKSQVVGYGYPEYAS